MSWAVTVGRFQKTSSAAVRVDLLNRHARGNSRAAASHEPSFNPLRPIYFMFGNCRILIIRGPASLHSQTKQRRRRLPSWPCAELGGQIGNITSARGRRHDRADRERDETIARVRYKDCRLVRTNERTRLHNHTWYPRSGPAVPDPCGRAGRHSCRAPGGEPPMPS